MVATGNTKRKVVVRKKPTDSGEPIEQMEAESASLVNLQAYVPSPEIAKKYVGRQIHGVWDATIAEEAMREGENILLMGDTGSGKTLFGEAVASKLRKLYYSVPCDISVDPSALFGKIVPDENTQGNIRWQDGPVTQVARGKCGMGANCNIPDCDGAGIINLSEINFLSPKISASTYPMLDHRRYIPLLAHQGEIVGLHKGTLVLCDMNPQYRGTMELNAAFLNRFAHKIQWGYSEEVESKLVHTASVKKIAEKARAMVGKELVTPVSTNMLMEFEKHATKSTLGLEYAVANFVSAFQPGERKAMSEVMKSFQVSLAADIAWLKKKQELALSGDEDTDSDDELEEIEFEYEEDK